jgi:ribonuclease HI
MSYYAVKAGKVAGIYRTWEECSQQVTGVKGSKYKKFGSELEALSYISCESPVRPLKESSGTEKETDAEVPNAKETKETKRKTPTRKDDTNLIFSIIHPCFGDIGPFDPARVLYVDGGCNRFTKPHACGSIVDHFNRDLIEMYASLFPDMTLVPMDLPGRKGRRLLIQVRFTDCVSQQNNGAELLATVAGLRIAMQQRGHFQYLFSDSSLIVDFWCRRISEESAKKMDPVKLGYVRELIRLTAEFEQSGGTIYKIRGRDNPADLGCHK